MTRTRFCSSASWSAIIRTVFRASLAATQPRFLVHNVRRYRFALLNRRAVARSASEIRSGSALRFDLHLALDLHRNGERQFRHADRAASVGSDVWPVQFEDQLGKPMDDARLLVEPRRGIDHAEDSHPGASAVEIAKGALQAAENGERRETRGFVAQFNSQFAPELAQQFRKETVRALRSVAGDDRASTRPPSWTSPSAATGLHCASQLSGTTP